MIDSVSRIAALSFGRNASVAYIMKRIVALQVKCKLSILVVADDSTKTVNNALLALAASEIPVDSENSENSEIPKNSEIPENSDSCSRPVIVGRLSRAERRRAEKLARKIKSTKSC